MTLEQKLILTGYFPLPIYLLLFFHFLEKAKQKLKKWQKKQSNFFSSMGPQEKTFASSKPQQAMIRVISCDPYITKTIQSELESILQKHLIKREVDVQEFSALEPMELEAVQAKIRVFGISLEHKKHQQNAGNTVRPEARAQTGSGKDIYVLEGLKEDVLSVTELIGRATQEALFKDFQDKEEAITALNVQWSLKGINGAWQEVSLRDNYMLEYAHTRDKIFVDIDAPDGSRVTVNLKTQEATNGVTGMTYKLKRIESGGLSHFLGSLFLFCFVLTIVTCVKTIPFCDVETLPHYLFQESILP